MPNWNHIVRQHLAPLRLSPQRENEIVEELALHLEAAFEDARAEGLPAAEAEARAVNSFDWHMLECELSRTEPSFAVPSLPAEFIERRGGIRMESLLQDLRFGVRMLMKQPGFTLIAVLTLALGIGANATLFSFFNGVLLRPLPYPQPERLVVLDEIAAQRGGHALGVSYSNYLDWRAQNQVFTDVAGYHSIAFTLTGVANAEQLGGAMASHGFFQLLGVTPLLGRTFTSEEDQPGRAKVVILSHGVWQRHFGGDPHIVGRSVTLGGTRQVVGVMPPAFRYPAGAEWWIPLTLTTQGWPRTMHGMGALARLKPGVTLVQAQREMSNLARRLGDEYPASNDGIEVRVTGLREHLSGDYRRGLLTLLGVVAFVLLIACANVANLLLARAATRQREMAVRAALGATRWALARQALGESLLLGVLGGGAGLLLARLGLSLLLAAIPVELPYWMKFSVDGRVLAFTLIVSWLTSLLFGAAPAWLAARSDVHDTLKTGGRGLTSGNRLRHALVVAQFALALILLIGAGLMMRSFLRLQQVELGFNPDQVMTLRVTTPGAGYRDGSGPFFERLLERVNALPGVTSAGAIAALPLTGVDDKWDNGLVTESQIDLTLQQAPRISTGIVTPQYFRTMEIPLLTGRAFDATDAQDVAIIDERLARAHWPDHSPLERRIRIGQADDRSTWYTIVGVAGAVQHDRLDATTRPTVYVPSLKSTANLRTLVVRSPLPAEAVLAAVTSVIKEMDANLPITHVAPLRAIVADSLWQPRLYALLFAVFAILALTLAAVGIYGVLSYAVAARTNEIGVRMALGAQPRDVLRLVMRQGMGLALGGVALGWLGAWPLTRWMQTMLFKVSATDAPTFAGVTLLLLAAAWLACWIPARRATQVDPLIALRHE